MKPNVPRTVTITGADDETDIKDLVELSEEFDFVEWGILVSKTRTGTERFPSRDWVLQFSEIARTNKLNVSTHVCGSWVNELLRGELDWGILPDSVGVSQRIQINTHAARYVVDVHFVQVLRVLENKNFIFQLDNVNDFLPYAAKSYGIKAQGLHDVSHGAGISPEHWPNPTYHFSNGYAGGLGPENVIQEIERINEVCRSPYWIDMETKVRTANDSQLDIQKVYQVLKSVKDLG